MYNTYNLRVSYGPPTRPVKHIASKSHTLNRVCRQARRAVPYPMAPRFPEQMFPTFVFFLDKLLPKR